MQDASKQPPLRAKFSFKPAEGQESGDFVILTFDDVSQFNSAVYECERDPNGRADIHCANGTKALINTSQLLFAAIIDNDLG